RLAPVPDVRQVAPGAAGRRAARGTRNHAHVLLTMSALRPPPPPDVVCFGESMVLLGANTAGDLADCAHFTRRLCGADSNVAIGLGRLGFTVRWISRVGDDAFGRFIIRALAAEGIDAAGIHVDPARRTGVMFKS